MESAKQIEIIENKCKDAGISIYDVFRRALIPVSTIQNWKRKEPDAFTVKKKIDDTIEAMISEKSLVPDLIADNILVKTEIEQPNVIVRRRRG